MKSLLLSTLMAATVEAAWKDKFMCVGKMLTKDASAVGKQTKVTCKAFCDGYMTKTLLPNATGDAKYCCLYDTKIGCMYMTPLPDDKKLWVNENVTSSYYYNQYTHSTKQFAEIASATVYVPEADILVWTRGASCSIADKDGKVTNLIKADIQDGKTNKSPVDFAGCKTLCDTEYAVWKKAGNTKDACCESAGPAGKCGLYDASTFKGGISFNGKAQALLSDGKTVNSGFAALIISKDTAKVITSANQKIWKIPQKGQVGFGCKQGADKQRPADACTATTQCCGAYKKAVGDTVQIEVCNGAKLKQITVENVAYAFTCIEGGKSLVASASALLAASYMLA